MSARFGSTVASAVLAVAALAGPGLPEAQAQGCVASRMEAPGGAIDPEGQSYYIPKGQWQASFGYRWYRSHRHFVGSVEQNAENVAKGLAERDRSSTEVINHMHLPAFSASYGVSDRFSLSADLPVVLALRKSPPRAVRPVVDRTQARGIGDLVLMARYWVGNPTGHAPHNLSLGLGFKLPTGKDEVTDEFLDAYDPATGDRRTSIRPVDQSIQPGDGGFGFIAEVQAFRSLGRVTAFASGSYLFNPREQNDFLRNPGATNPNPTSAYLSVADQYAARVGLGLPVGKKLGVSLAARLEGVPSSDVFGGDLGRRRPGYSIGIEPGISYSWKGNAVSLSVPYLVRRVRTQNISDKIETQETGEFQNGDAAFADYVVVVGFSRRF